MSYLSELSALAIVHARAGVLPLGALEAVTEAGGAVLIIGDGAAAGAASAVAAAAGRAWWCETGPGLHAGRLVRRLAPVVAGVPLVVLPGSPDGRDLAPRLAAQLGRPLLAGACRAELTGSGVRAQLCRLDDRITIPAEVDGPAVVTLAPGTGTISPPRAASPPRAGAPAPASPPAVTPLALPEPESAQPGSGGDVAVLEILDPDPSTMELAEAPLVFSGGAGLAAGLDLPEARAAFGLLAAVAAAVGASAGATRVATDAGWAGPDRQIGTTGVAIAPRLYVAFGVSGAAQHTGGLGAPEHIVSVNLDAHCPMTAMSSLGVIADARGTLAELARRVGAEIPPELRDAT
jgi:electron transfer flavoprotein alpha subunit